MARLPQLSGRQLVSAFLKDGWVLVSQKGSHVKLRKALEGQGQKTIIVPLHKSLKKGTLSGILKDSGVSLKRLKELL